MDGKELIEILSGELRISVLVLSANVSEKDKYITCGALGFIEKPNLKEIQKDFYDNLLEVLKRLDIKIAVNPAPLPPKKVIHRNFKIVCVGASTGGPKTVSAIFKALGDNFPLPILFVQHIELGTDKSMVKWFETVCPNVHMVLAKEGLEIKNGLTYMAPANYHLEVTEKKGRYFCHLSDAPEERFLRPSVDHLFNDCARVYGTGCLGVLLTGMGRDGAEGCKEIVDSGGYTLVESEESCVVFGMPKAAIELNAASETLDKDTIPKRIKELLKK